LIIGNSCRGYEIIEYMGKEKNLFTGCRRGVQLDVEEWMSTKKISIGMPPSSFGIGTVVMSFDAVFNGVRPREPEIYIQVIRPPEIPVNVNAVRINREVEITWDTPFNHQEIKEYIIYRKENDSGWNLLGRTSSADKCIYRDDQTSSKASLYAVTSVEQSGVESDKSRTAPVLSEDGEDFPDEMIIPAGDFLGGIFNSKRSSISTTLDINAHNRTVIVQENGSSSVDCEFILPMRTSAEIRIRAKTPERSSYMIIVINETERINALIQESEFTWVTAHSTVKDQLLQLKKGGNRLKIITPTEKRCEFDQIQLKLYRNNKH
jgi:hypothetical protein